MARVLNLTGNPLHLFAKDGDSCLIPTGESKVADKFCINVPPRVKVLEMKKSAAKIEKPKETPKPAANPVEEAPVERVIKSSKNKGE